MAVHGFVYVARARETGHVKIGFTARPAWRFQQLAADAQQLIDVVAIKRGTRQDEAAMLRQMDAYRVRFSGCREWLRPCPEVDAFVASLGSHRIGRMTFGRGVGALLGVRLMLLFHRYTRAIEAHCARFDAATEGA